MIKVSVIIPTYNVENYVARCLDSVINQTLSDIEIIIVDDASTDNTLSIVQEYVNKDSRIKLFKRDKNQGLSVVRNVGIDESNGKYIGFVDSDDYIDLDFFEKLYDKAVEGGADIVAGNIREFRLDGSQRVFNDLLDRINISKFNFLYTIWYSIYKSEFIKKNKLYNPVGIIKSQDTVFVSQCACLCNKVDTVYDTYYNYIRRANTLDSEILPEKTLKSDIDGMHLIMDFVNMQNISEHDYNTLMSGYLNFFSHNAFFRNPKRSVRIMLMNSAIDIYKKYKYKNFIKEQYPEIQFYLESEDAEALYKYNEGFLNPITTKKIKLFGIIPIIKLEIYNQKHKCKIYVFGILFLVIKQ